MNFTTARAKGGPWVKTEFNVVITLINSNNSINENKLGAFGKIK